MAKVIIVVNTDFFFLSHRKAIGARAIRDGHEVIIVAKATDPEKVAEIKRMGARFVNLPGNPTGTNFFQEMKTLRFLNSFYRKEKPDLVHHVSIKNVLWGSLAARSVGVPAVLNAVCGLGFTFQNPKSRMAKMILSAMKLGMSRPNLKVIFQNSEDRQFFLDHKIISEKECLYVKGSGVDLEEYPYCVPELHSKTVVIFSARMVEEKGVRTVIEAAELLRIKYQDQIEFRLCGGLYDSPNALSAQWFADHCDGEYIIWMDKRTDMPEMLAQCDIMIFPSFYKEGLPKSVVEATAIGRPVITTDSVGCRDTVDDGVTGILIPAKDAQALADAIEKLHLDPAKRLDMGRAARRKAEREFDVRNVVDFHSRTYSALLSNCSK